MEKIVQLKENGNNIYPVVHRKWKKLTTDYIYLSSLNTNHTINLIEPWDKYTEILIIVGESEYREYTPLVLYPDLPSKGAVYSLIALSSYQFFAYICLGATINDSSDKYKVCCCPREVKGYPLNKMKIIAVYGR